ncbi:MAG: SRPBCC family protein [Acetobacteraceae bacterium]
MLGEKHGCATARSITKTVRIACNPDAAFAFLADLGNWPRWAVVNVKSTSRSDDPEWWDMVTPHGTARLRMRADARYGILDHDFVDPQASWTVPARLIRNGEGAEFVMTFFQPPGFADAFFDQQIKLVDIELAKLKELLEVPIGKAAPG